MTKALTELRVGSVFSPLWNEDKLFFVTESETCVDSEGNKFTFEDMGGSHTEVLVRFDAPSF